MLRPTYEKLADMTAARGPGIFNAGCSAVHPNPRLYKYYWWIFTQDSPVEGFEFLTDEYRLSTANFQSQVAYCKQHNISAYIFNQKQYRYDTALPWDYDKLQQREGIIFAPGFDDDPDPLTPEGLK